MDYLAVLSTRYVVLFAPDAAAKSGEPASTSSSPRTPTATTGGAALAPPLPIAMPLHALMYDDTHAAYFLQHHLVSRPYPRVRELGSAEVQSAEAAPAGDSDDDDDAGPSTPTFDFAGRPRAVAASPRDGATPHRLGAVSPAAARAAEVLAWQEIDKAKAFGRALGACCAGAEAVGEDGMRELARACGVVLAGPDGWVGGVELEGGGDRGHGASGHAGLHERKTMMGCVSVAPVA